MEPSEKEFIGRQTQAMGALLSGVYQRFNLKERMPRRFRERGWPLDDRCHIASAAVACVLLKAVLTNFMIPPGTNDDPYWSSIAGRKVSAAEIVDTLELRDMLDFEAPRSVIPVQIVKGR